MRKLAILTAIVMIAALPVALFAGGGAEKNAAATKPLDKVVYAYATFNNIANEQALGTVQDAINAITRTRIGAEIELKPIAIWDYSSQVSLELQSGDKIDVFQALGNFPNAVATIHDYPGVTGITSFLPNGDVDKKLLILTVVGNSIMAAP